MESCAKFKITSFSRLVKKFNNHLLKQSTPVNNYKQVDDIVIPAFSIMNVPSSICGEFRTEVENILSGNDLAIEGPKRKQIVVLLKL